MDILNSIFPIIVAFITCFFGYKMNKLCITLAAFVLGFIIGGTITGMVTTSTEICYIVGAVTGFIFGLIGFKLYLVGVFLLCFVSVLGIAKVHIENTTIMWIVGIIGGILVGLIGTKFVKPVMILTTAIGGGITLAYSLLTLIKQQNSTYLFIVEIILITLGIMYQWKSNKGIVENKAENKSQ